MDAVLDATAPTTPLPMRLPLRRPALLRFVTPNLPVQAVIVPLGVYVPAYYGGYVGLSLATVGFAFFLVRTLDIVFDPLMGVVVDRTRTRFGQVRPWMVVGALLITLSCPLLFFTPPGGTVARMAAGLLVLYAGTSIVTIAHSAWAARLATDYNDRSRIWAWMQILGAFGSFLIIVLPLGSGALGRDLPPGAEVHMMGVMVLVLMPVMTLLALWRTPEPAAPEGHAGADHRILFVDYIRLMRIPSVARIILADILIAIASGCTTALFVFFWTAARGVPGGYISTLIIFYMLGGFLGVPFWMWMAKVTSKHLALMLAVLGFVIAIPTVGLLPVDPFWPIIPVYGFLGFTFSAGAFLLRAMIADVGDQVRLETGVDRLGQLYAFLASTQKLGSAIAIGVTYWVLSKVGFEAKLGAANPASAVLALQLMFVAVPAVLMLGGALGFIGYKLDKREHDRILNELRAIDRAA